MSEASNIGILFLHALPLDGTMWTSQMDVIPGHTYAPTLYSFGASLKDWAIKALAVPEEEKLIVVGCSVGGSCALEIAQLAPDRVVGLVLIGTKPNHRPQPTLKDEALAIIDQHGVAAAWNKYWAPLFSQDTHARTVQAAKETSLRLPAGDIANGVSVFHTRESRDQFVCECNIPITIVTGADDVAPGVKLSSDTAASAQKGTLHVLPSCGHYVPLEQPEALREILLDVVANI